MATPTFPWTEPIRLTFSSLDPGRTSVRNAGAPSPPIAFRSGHTTPQPPSRMMPGTNVDLPVGLLWSSSNGQALPFSRVSQCSSTDSLSLEYAPSEPVESPKAHHQPLYVVFPDPKRRRSVRFWKRKRKTYIVRGGGGAEPVATIVWPEFHAPEVEMAGGLAYDRGRGPSIHLRRSWDRRRPLQQRKSARLWFSRRSM